MHARLHFVRHGFVYVCRLARPWAPTEHVSADALGFVCGTGARPQYVTNIPQDDFDNHTPEEKRAGATRLTETPLTYYTRSYRSFYSNPTLNTIAASSVAPVLQRYAPDLPEFVEGFMSGNISDFEKSHAQVLHLAVFLMILTKIQ